MRLALPDWKPGKVEDPVQRVRNFLYVAAVPDVFQMQELERFVPQVVYERIQEDIPKEDLIKILYWIATHPFDGDDKAVDELRPLGLFNGPADMEQTRGRLSVYAVKLLGASQDIKPEWTVDNPASRESQSVESQSTVRVDSRATARTHMSKQRSTLPTRALGTTGMAITRVGFGAWAIGGGGWAFAWGSQDDDESIAAMRHAVERGVNWIDTAAVYGLGHSEVLVGKLLRDYPAADRPFVFTKCGLVWDEQNPMTQALRIGAAASLRREVEQSLTRLGVEQIDLYQMHWPAEDGTPVESYWQTLLDVKKEGKVRAVGLSNHKVDRLEAAERLGHVDTLQPPFSPIRRDALAAELPWCTRAQHRRHRLQPHAIRSSDRIVHRSPGGGTRQGRLALASRPSSRAHASRATSRSPKPCGRSPRDTARPSARSPSRGRSPPLASPARSSAPATRRRWMAGSLPAVSS